MKLQVHFDEGTLVAAPWKILHQLNTHMTTLREDVLQKKIGNSVRYRSADCKITDITGNVATLVDRKGRTQHVCVTEILD